LELGVDDYVTKPFDPLDLIARVNTLLARRAAEAVDDVGANTGDSDGNGSEPAEPPTIPVAITEPPVALSEAPVVSGEADRLDGQSH
jgi:DNA-binding response OmpR family regulator